MDKENRNNVDYWNNYYRELPRKDIVSDDWLWHFNDIIDKSERPIIDLGCGFGNDTMYLVERNKTVIPCDCSFNAIANIENNFPEVKAAKCFDMLNRFPFENNITDLVIADLCLHYFTREDTIMILKEIRRILVNKGHMLARVNSINDDNYKSNIVSEVEPHLYRTKDGRLKRYFSYEDIYDFFKLFDIKYVREEEMNRYGPVKKLFTVCVKNRS